MRTLCPMRTLLRRRHRRSGAPPDGPVKAVGVVGVRPEGLAAIADKARRSRVAVLSRQQRAGGIDQHTAGSNQTRALLEQALLQGEGLGQIKLFQSPPERWLASQSAGA